MTQEQFQQLLLQIQGMAAQAPAPAPAPGAPRANPRHFTQCVARFDGTRSHAAVEEFITAATIFKEVEGIEDAEALAGLPLLLMKEANQWWSGTAFQPEGMPTDRYVTIQRDRLAQMTRHLDEEWQIDVVYGLLRHKIRDKIPRSDIGSFNELLNRARAIEENEKESAAGPVKSQKTNGTTTVKANGGKNRARCSFCRAFGHDVGECRKLKTNTTSGPPSAPNAIVPRVSTDIRCYGCQRPGVFRRNCPDCNPPTAPVSAPTTDPTGFCAINTSSQPRRRPTVNIEILGITGTALLDTAAGNSVASISLYQHLLRQGCTPRKEKVEATLADGGTRLMEVPTVTTNVKLAGKITKTTFIVLSTSEDTKTLLGADFIEDSGVIIDLKRQQFYFEQNPNEKVAFANDCATPTDEDIRTVFQATKVEFLSPLDPEYIANGYGPPPPDNSSMIPSVITPGGTWNIYQAPGGADYMLQDANEMLMHYDQYHDEYQTDLFATIPYKTEICSLELRPTEGQFLTTTEKHKINRLVKEYRDLFAEFGPPTPYATHRINTGDSLPVAVPPYRLTCEKRKVLQMEIERLLQQGIIEECDSAWASPVVMVPKANGTIRLCVDYRKLNAVTKPDVYPLPRLDDLLHATGKIGCITTLDLQAGYWQIQVEPGDRDKTSFICPFGLYRFTRMPFGLRNAPASFQRLMDKFKTGIPDVPILAYLDDLIIISPDGHTHIRHLRTVLMHSVRLFSRGRAPTRRPVEYASRLLTSSERNYSTTEREALAIVWAISKFRGYVGENSTTVITDHQPLRWFMSLKTPTGRLARWALQLQPYNLVIEYTPGKANTIADFLSRPATEESSMICTVQIDLPARSDADIRNEQLKDPEVKKILDELMSSNPEIAQPWSSRGYVTNRGVLYRYSQADDYEEAQLVVPHHERLHIMKQHHDSPTGGHYGVDKTYSKIACRYYWPGMRRDVSDYLRTCIACQRYKASNLKPPGLLQTPVLQQRLEVISIDLFGPLPPSNCGEKWIFIVEDTCTRWVELFPLVDATAEMCAWTLLNDVCFRYGLPRRIISDNGSQFVSAIMQKLTFCLGISQSFTPVYHPEANPVERKNRDLKTQLAIQIGDNPHSTWPEKLPTIRFAMNTTPCSSTSVTPAFLMFGRELRTIDDVTNDLRHIVESETFVAEATPKLLLLSDTWKKARETHEDKQDHRKEAADRTRRTAPEFQPGDLVLVQLHTLSSSAKEFSSKLAPKRDGPYVILRRHGPTSYEIAAQDQPSQALGTYHSSQLTPYRGLEKEVPPPVVPIRRRGRPRKHNVQNQVEAPPRRSPRLNEMAIQMTQEQFQQLLLQIQGMAAQAPAPAPAPGAPRANPRHFTQCVARFDGTRSHAAVEEFITAATIFKEVEGIEDAEALAGLPLMKEANQWWSGVKNNVDTWDAAMQLIRNAFAPRRPNYRLFLEIFGEPQPEGMPTDRYVTIQRDRLAQMTRHLDEEWQIDVVYGLLRHKIRDKIPRSDIGSFNELLNRARAIEENEKESAAGPVKSQKTNGTTTVKANGGKNRARCSFCRAFGHDVGECRKLKTNTTSGPPSAPNAIVPRVSTDIRCYGCQRPGVFRRNCPDCNPPTAPVSAPTTDPTGFCAINTSIQPRRRPTVNIEILGITGTALLDTAAGNSVASISLYQHLLRQGCTPRKEKVEATLADGGTRLMEVPTVTTNVKLAGKITKTTFIVLSTSEDTKTLLGADFIEDSGVIIDLKHQQFYFEQNPNEKVAFANDCATPTDEDIRTVFQATKIEFLSPLDPEYIANGYGPPPPDNSSIIPSVITPGGTWNIYQAPGGADYMLQDANEMLMHYDQYHDEYQTDLFATIPYKTEICSLELRPTEGQFLTTTEKHEINRLVKEYRDLFAEFGPPTPYATHRINTGDSLPVAVPPYRLTCEKRKVLQMEIERLLQQGIIEECDSAWASPVVMVPKANGTIRLCVDYHKLNAVTKPDVYPLPRLDDLLHATGKIGCITTLDLQAGYWQIQVEPGDRDKTSFICPFGLYRFTRMPFGLRNAPASFQRLMDKFKTGIPDVPILAYLDDLIIISPDGHTHIRHLRSTFDQLRRFQLRINRNKCLIGCSEVRYLGHRISPSGIAPDEKKVEAIKQIPPPRNLKQLQSFLQTCSWFRRFIDQFASVARPLSELTKKNASWKWGNAQDEAFTTLKEKLTTAPILRAADPTQPFILRTDSSAYALGAALLQGEGPDERPVEYASRLLTSSERNYSTTEREALAIVWAISKFRGYVGENSTTVITDHQALRWLMSLKTPTGRLARWALQLQPYNLVIEYTPGKANTIADFLSRPATEESSMICTVQIDLPARSDADIRNEQLKDPEVKKILDELMSSNPEIAQPWSSRGYVTNRGVLYRYSQADDYEEAQLVVPHHERLHIMKQHHDSPTGGHYGVDKTYSKIACRYYWPGMRRDVSDYLRTCIACQRYKASNLKPPGLLQTPVLQQRLEVISIDLFGPLPPSNCGEKWIFIVEDTCTSTSVTPAFLMFGRELRTIDDVTNDLRHIVESETFVAEATPKLLLLSDTWKKARETHEDKQDHRKEAADRTRRTAPEFQPGDLVLVQLHTLSSSAKEFSSKLAPKRDGPYVILRRHGPTSYEIAAQDQPSQALGTYHSSQLTPYHGLEKEVPPPVVPIRRRGRPRKHNVQNQWIGTLHMVLRGRTVAIISTGSS
ncbi:hypothetical protein TcasGA2_TC034535 [Tribolium castaneum]|uniref:RNA-directed DNA polymerase n=1 Tax=Tribolium castaneum TaxID=7070 RepID=A0A139WPF5_TRICA|nr:hypothetical protein TcasGA2_TC034535 [Tribolium castaneum]